MQLIAETRVAGRFCGWRRQSKFKLENGQSWVQIDTAYVNHFAFRPKARIWQDGSKHLIEVEGAYGRVQVRRTAL